MLPKTDTRSASPVFHFPELGRCEKKGITIGDARWITGTMRRSSSHDTANVKWDNDPACNESGKHLAATGI
jgi:hypothetical protein